MELVALYSGKWTMFLNLIFDENIFRTNRFTDGAITTWSGTITVNATLAINNTLIECVVQGSSTNPDTQEVRIIIAG